VLVRHGKSFAKSNCLPLEELHGMMISLVFRDNLFHGKAFHLTKENNDFILSCLSASPAETGIPAFSDRTVYFPAMTNYLYYGRDNQAGLDRDLKICNIVGQAYGFLSDCAYFSDSAHHVEFFLSATIYVNKDQIVNDGVYEYATVGFPFMKDLGRLIYDYELKRKR
jgi:hypothetical protein